MKRLLSLALTLSLLISLFSVAFNVGAASLYGETDLLSGSLFDSTAVITSDGTDKSVSNNIWSFSTLAGIGSTNTDISEIDGITIDDGKTLLSDYNREGVKIYAISNNNGDLNDAVAVNSANATSLPLDFDGKIGAHNDFQNLNQLVTETSSGVYNSRRNYNYTVDFIVDLGSVCDISGFMVAGSNSEKFVPGMYRIYASKEMATLFNNQPLIDFTDSYASDAVAKANANAMFSLNSGNKVLARYVAFRIADVCCQNVKDQSADFLHNNFRGSELAVYGTPVATKEGVTAIVTTSSTPAAPEGYDSIIESSEGKYVLPSKESRLYDPKTGTKNPTSNLYDGIYAADGYDDYTVSENTNGYGQQSATLGYTVDDSFYTQITHTLMDTAVVEKIQVVGHSNAMLTTGRYVLYASDNKVTLYDPENIIYDYDNSTIVDKSNVCALTGSNANRISRQQVFDFGEGFKAKYIGMRVYDPCGYIGKTGYNAPGSDGGAVYLRLHEFNVFGVSEYSISNNNYNFSQYEENVNITRSLIADKDAVYTRYNNYLTGDVGAAFTPSYVATTAAPDTRSLTSSHAIPVGNVLSKGAFYALDLKNASGVAYAEGETKDNVTDTYVDNGVDMNHVYAYDMGGDIQVSSFSFISHTSTVLQIAKYQVSFANDAEQLFTNDAVYTTDVLNATASSATLNFKVEIVARYVGFKVVSGVREAAVGSGYKQSDCYTRLSHLDVFGISYGSLSTVTFTDKKNNELFVANTDAEGYLDESELEYVNALVPAIYGYTGKLTADGKQEWSADVYGAVPEDITVTPVYEADSTLRYTVTHNKLQGDPVVKEVGFDERVTLTDDAAASFKVGDSVIGGAGEVSFYAAGDLTVDSSADTAPTTPTATIINTAEEKVGDKTNWRIFAHAYLPEGYEAVETGAVFVSPYTENQLFKDDIADWNLSVLGTKYPYVATKGGEGKSYAMLTLGGVAAETTRYVKAYVAYTDGSSAAAQYAYSVKLTKTF